MNYLVVVAHPDDEVLGAGATILKLQKEGHTVAIATMSNHAAARANISVTLSDDQKRAHEILGVKKSYSANFPNIKMNTVPHLELTLKGDENKHIRMLKRIVVDERLPIDFIGSIDIEAVYDYYSKSILIFPSYIETFGLPLLEARKHESPILASNCAFSHEVLEGYDRVKFFNPFESRELGDLMADSVRNY